MHDQLTGVPDSGAEGVGLSRPVVGRGLGVSISAPGRLLERGLRDVLRYAVWAEELGFSTVTIGEHVVVGADVTARGSDRWYTQGQLWPDPLVTLGAVAAVTERVRLGTNIYIAPLRPAVTVAKMAATVDALSNGRLNFGVGAGWHEPEFQAVGMPFRGRFARMEDTLRACKALWTHAPATFHSLTVSFDDVWCLPRPVQTGGPPILIAGDPGGPMARRIAELGDGWVVRTGAVRDGAEEEARIVGDLARIRDAVAAAGRDPDGLHFQIGTRAVRDASGAADLEATFATVRRYWELGIGQVQISLAQFVDRPTDVRPFLATVAGALLG